VTLEQLLSHTSGIPSRDLGIVVLTNFPEGKAVAAADEVVERLYREFGSK